MFKKNLPVLIDLIGAHFFVEFGLDFAPVSVESINGHM